MILNFTLLKQPINHLKVGLIVNTIGLLHQVTSHLNLLPCIGLDSFSLDSYGLEEVVTDTEPLTHTTTEPIQGVASIMLLENSKLYFLLLYIAIIVLLVIFLETMNRKKKQNFQQAIAPKDLKEYFVEKISIVNKKRDSSYDKELMSCEVKDEILKKLLLFEEGTKYTDKNFNLSALSVKLKINTKYLSFIINKYKKKDFNSYINELRILYIIKKMESNPSYLNYKISYLADECGFSSHSKFTAVFKTVVGMSPSHFMDQLAKKHNNEHSIPTKLKSS